jgi:hypothetical protein
MPELGLGRESLFRRFGIRRRRTQIDQEMIESIELMNAAACRTDELARAAFQDTEVEKHVSASVRTFPSFSHFAQLSSLFARLGRPPKSYPRSAGAAPTIDIAREAIEFGLIWTRRSTRFRTAAAKLADGSHAASLHPAK